MSTYLLLTDDPGFEARTRAALGLSNGRVQRRPATDADGTVPLGEDPGAYDVIAVGPGLADEDALVLAEQLDRAHPEANLVLVLDAPLAARDLERAIVIGVRGVVTADTDDDELTATFQRAAASAARRRRSLLGDGADNAARRTVVLLSPKGGAGKTMVAVNLAAGLATSPGATVALVDLDLAFGDTASALGLVPEYSFASVCDVPRIDHIALKVFLTPHPPTGLFTLCAPEDPAESDLVTPATAADVVSRLAGEFSHVVVDTPAGISEHTLAVLEVASDILLVCTMDVASVRSLRKAVDALDELGHSGPRRVFVLNRAPSRVGLTVEDIERTVGLPVAASVPSHRSIPVTMNQGTPLVTTQLRSPARSALGQVRDLFVPQQARTTAWTAARRVLS